MKRINQIILLIAIGAMIMVFSCSKQETKMEPDNSKNFTPYEMQVNKTIKDFKQTIVYYHENPDFKSSETVNADSALWLLEATINYSHAFPNEYYEEMQTEDLTLTVPKNIDGTVDMDMVIQKYDEMKGDITTVYNGVNYTYKGLVLVDLTETSQTSTELTMNVQTVTGEKGTPPPPPVNGPFTEVDDWWYGDNVGYCYAPYTVIDDAANQLFQATLSLVPEPNGTYYFIDEYTFDVSGGDPDLRRPNDDEDNYLDYYLYYSIEGDQVIPFNTDEMLCVEYQEMNNYYSFMNNMMFNVLPNHYLPNVIGLYGYSIVSLNSIEDHDYTDEDYTYYYHEAEFTYGIKVGYDQGEGPTEL